MDTSFLREMLLFVRDHWISFLVGLLGVIGSVASIVSWISAASAQKNYENLFRYVDLNVDKSITEETVERIKDEQKHIEQRIIDLKAQIRREIPIEARKAILKDRHERATEDLAKVHHSLLRIREELHGLGETTNLSEEILTVVRSEIQPKYILREKLAFQRNIFTALSGLAALSSALLPYPLGKMSAIALLIFSIPSSFLFLHLTVAEKGGWRGAFGKKGVQMPNQAPATVFKEQG